MVRPLNIQIVLLAMILMSCSAEETEERPDSITAATADDENDKEKASADGGTLLTYYQDAQPILASYCTTCHGENPAPGAGDYYRLNRYASQGFLRGAYDMRLYIKAQIEDGTMPPAGSAQPSDKEARTLLAWIAQGAKAGDPSDTGGKSGQGGDNTKGRVTFLTAIAQSEAPNDSNVFTIKASFTGYNGDFTWSISYFNATTPANRIPLAAGLPDTQTEYQWYMSARPTGRYGLVITVEEKSYVSPGFVDFNNPGVNNNNPKVTLAGAWQGGGGQVIGSANDIEYTATDRNNDPISIKIELSSDRGSTYPVTITNNAGSVTNYSWDAAAAGIQEGLRYRIRLTATDDAGGRTVVESNSDVALGSKLYTWTNDAFPQVIDPLCSSCHRNRPYDSDIYSGSSGAYNYRNSLVDLTVRENMPNNGNKANARQKEILQLWLRQGAVQ